MNLEKRNILNIGTVNVDMNRPLNTWLSNITMLARKHANQEYWIFFEHKGWSAGLQMWPSSRVYFLTYVMYKKNKCFSLSGKKKLKEKDVKFVSSQINNIQIAYIIIF